MPNNAHSQAPTSGALTATRWGLAILASAVAVAFLTVSAAQAEVVTHQMDFVEQTQFVPCANGGVGENVAISGVIHFRAQFTILDQKVSHMFFANVQNGTGVGLVTGDQYRWSGVTRSTGNQSFENGSLSTTSVFTWHVIGQGGASNFVIHTIFHTTITPSGDIAVTFDGATLHCQ